jgi:hypothetical protein
MAPARSGVDAAAALTPFKDRFTNQTALVFATGPSLTKLWHPERPLLCPAIAVNDAHRIVPGADILYGTDVAWWQHHQAVPGFKGLRVGYRGPGPAGVAWLQGSGTEGFDSRLGYVRHGFNSGHAAVHLAAQLGAVRIVLVGFDMRDPNGKAHFFGNHSRQIERRHLDHYARWIGIFAVLAKELEKRGIQVLNATPGSALKCFPFVRLEDVCREPCALSVETPTTAPTPSSAG